MLVVLRVALIFLLVAVLAGGIAMLGNQLGRKIGRRKMTLFGLRPRYTSIFMTTITGSVIACLTLALSMFFSQDIREAVIGSSMRLSSLLQREQQLTVRVNQLSDQVRRGTIIWNYDEKIALTTIRPYSTHEEVEKSISELIIYANYLTITKNNKVALFQNAPLYKLDPPPVLISYTEEDFDGWVNAYTGKPDSVGLWLVVTENCLFKDKVPITVASFPVKVIYEQGQVVYSREIDPKTFLVDWYKFLDELKSRALKSGMIEMNDSMGELTGEQLGAVSKMVFDAGERVRLKAVANRELYQSSNLDVSIKVESH